MIRGRYAWYLTGLLVIAGCSSSTGPKNANPQGWLYVLNQTDSTIFTFSTAGFARVDSFSAGINQPHFIEFSHDGRFFYVVSRDFGGRIAKFDRLSNTLLDTVRHSGVFPTAMAITLDGAFGYVADFSLPGEITRLYKLDLTSMTVVDSVQAGAMTHDVQITSDGSLILATNMSDQVTMIYTDVDSVFQVPIDPDSLYAPTRMKYGPYGLAIDPNDSLAYIACLNHVEVQPQIRVLDISQRRIIDSIVVPIRTTQTPSGPTLAEVSPDGKHLWVTTQFGNAVFVIRLSTRTIEREIPFSTPKPFGVAITDDGRRVYVACANATNQRGRVYMIDGGTYDVLDSVDVGQNSFGLAWQQP